MWFEEYSSLSLSVHFVTKQILEAILASFLNEYLCFLFIPIEYCLFCNIYKPRNEENEDFGYGD